MVLLKKRWPRVLRSHLFFVLSKSMLYPLLLVQLLLQFLHSISTHLEIFLGIAAEPEDKLGIPGALHLHDIFYVDDMLPTAAEEHLGIQFGFEFVHTL